MRTKLFSLASSLHTETVRETASDPFVRQIEDALGEKFIHRGSNFTDYCPGDIIFIRTGGTEDLFRRLVGKKDAILLASGESNSLAASMEILSWLNRQGCRGEILHGSPGSVAARIHALTGGQEGTVPCGTEMGRQFQHPLSGTDLGGIRLGVIGRPSDWLISSEVDYGEVKRVLNAELVDIPMEELLLGIDEVCREMQAKTGKEVDTRSFEGSEAIHTALKVLVGKHRLGGLTLRCFDLLDTVHNTGCLALARLNADGIPSSCEGDIPALLTMAWLRKTKGCPGFQCNLSRIEGDEFLFAHCTVPLDMVSSFRYDTHFESGIGTAIKGEMRPEEVEIVKISPDLRNIVRIPGRIIGNHCFRNLCRTQIAISAPGASDYFLQAPYANHHIVSYK